MQRKAVIDIHQIARANIDTDGVFFHQPVETLQRGFRSRRAGRNHAGIEDGAHIRQYVILRNQRHQRGFFPPGLRGLAPTVRQFDAVQRAGERFDVLAAQLSDRQTRIGDARSRRTPASSRPIGETLNCSVFQRRIFNMEVQFNIEPQTGILFLASRLGIRLLISSFPSKYIE